MNKVEWSINRKLLILLKIIICKAMLNVLHKQMKIFWKHLDYFIHLYIKKIKEKLKEKRKKKKEKRKKKN